MEDRFLEYKHEWTDRLSGSKDDALRLCEPIEQAELSGIRVS